MTTVSALPVELSMQGAVALMRLCNPGKRNALDAGMRAALADAIGQVRCDSSIKALVLSGSQGCFCAGGDLRGLAAMAGQERDIFEGRSRIRGMHRWFEDLLDLEVPVIAAVDSAAFGAGLSLVLAADFVFASPQARFCAVFARIGYVPDLGAMYLLPRTIGLRAAKDMAFSAREVLSTEALELGLVQQIIPGDVEVAALAYAARFEMAPTGAIGMAKAIMNHTFETERAGIFEQEAMAQAMCRESAFHREAVRRFMAKEAPQFDWDKQ